MSLLRQLSSGALTAVLVGLAAPVHAQGPTQPASAARWEIDAFGGVTMGRIPAGGTISLPAPGASLMTSGPLTPTRRVPSWLFGDGATILNGVASQMDLPNRVTPFEAAFAAIGSNSAMGGAMGVRIRRTVTPTISAEASLDLTMSSDGSSALRDAAEATRASFEATFAALLTTGPFSNPIIEATIESADRSRREVALTGAVVVRLPFARALAPYATLGGGVRTGAGDGPSATVDVRYRFRVDGTVPIDERDRAAISRATGRTLIGVVGGGVHRALSARWGLRIDARAFIGRNSTRIRLDANPTVATGTPADFVESGTNPAIQFSNDPATGRQSTLGGPGLQGFSAFLGSGIETRLLLTVGLCGRF